jgi:hypothetical protein
VIDQDEQVAVRAPTMLRVRICNNQTIIMRQQ